MYHYFMNNKAIAPAGHATEEDKGRRERTSVREDPGFLSERDEEHAAIGPLAQRRVRTLLLAVAEQKSRPTRLKVTVF
jgi:hypothetical protein